MWLERVVDIVSANQQAGGQQFRFSIFILGQVLHFLVSKLSLERFLKALEMFLTLPNANGSNCPKTSHLGVIGFRIPREFWNWYSVVARFSCSILAMLPKLNPRLWLGCVMNGPLTPWNAVLSLSFLGFVIIKTYPLGSSPSSIENGIPPVTRAQ